MKRTIARRVILLVCIISAGLLPFPTAQSLDLNLRASAGLDATVGLDDKTRAVIEGLPKEVRDQIIGLLRDALPLIDTSVLTYMNRVNEIVDSQINHVQCAAEGIAKSVAGTAKEIFGIKPAPIAALKAVKWRRYRLPSARTTIQKSTRLRTPIFYTGLPSHGVLPKFR